MLAIVGGDAGSWGHLALFLQACSLLQLRYLILHCNYILFNDSTTSIVDIPGSLFNVVSIRLRGAYFCWDRCNTFKFLKILCIHEIKAEFGPDWSAWEAMVDAAPGMEKLSLSRRAPDHHPHLTHLDIVFKRDEMLSGLVSRFGTPELVTLSIAAKHTQEL
ncbi:hypothetical protein DFH09DRAFT_1304186 [Mycena vulgaris]|nr:hypothetical protein DFH09DRAFT_1304186 [Mycena vulgaris]